MQTTTLKFEKLTVIHNNRDWVASGAVDLEYEVAARQPDIGYMSRRLVSFAVVGPIVMDLTDVETGHIWPRVTVNAAFPVFHRIVTALSREIEQHCIEASTEMAL